MLFGIKIETAAEQTVSPAIHVAGRFDKCAVRAERSPAPQTNGSCYRRIRLWWEMQLDFLFVCAVQDNLICFFSCTKWITYLRHASKNRRPQRHGAKLWSRSLSVPLHFSALSLCKRMFWHGLEISITAEWLQAKHESDALNEVMFVWYSLGMHCFTWPIWYDIDHYRCFRFKKETFQVFTGTCAYSTAIFWFFCAKTWWRLLFSLNSCSTSIANL